MWVILTAAVSYGILRIVIFFCRSNGYIGRYDNLQVYTIWYSDAAWPLVLGNRNLHNFWARNVKVYRIYIPFCTLPYIHILYCIATRTYVLLIYVKSLSYPLVLSRLPCIHILYCICHAYIDMHMGYIRTQMIRSMITLLLYMGYEWPSKTILGGGGRAYSPYSCCLLLVAAFLPEIFTPK